MGVENIRFLACIRLCMHVAKGIVWVFKSFLMRRKHSKLRMGFRGRSGLLATVAFGSAVMVALYYAWSSYFGGGSPNRISFSSVQGLAPGQLAHWHQERERQAETGGGPVIEDPPIGLNKEIELQVANENWKKAKALQDRIDEERLAEEQSAQGHGKHIDSILKTRKENPGIRTSQVGERQVRPLLYRPADPLDGDFFSKLERIVHLDLKGAPPLVSYLEKLFPVLKNMGATGLLMEYEDMFPYSGSLSKLTSASAYSLSDLQRIQAAARGSGLEIIPLVQTFGHLEFVLKLKEFAELREHDYTPQVITPVRQESYTLIYSILEQVIKAHPESRRIHLGCDEVYGLGQGQSSTYMTSHGLTPEKLFLEHVVKMARHLKAAFPKLQPLIWDDWLRKTPYEELADSGLGGLVEPVVWYYRHDILDRVPSVAWDNYSKLFSGVWVASAFKGATGSAQILTNASFHLDNNLQWVSIVRKFGIHNKKIAFRGAVLTGWQRYDHFSTLCELLPVGMPSLALSLQAWKVGAFGRQEIEGARSVLGCSNPLDLEFPSLKKDGASVSQDCSFPGRDILYGVQQLWGIMEVYRRDRGLQDIISGWLTDTHVRQGISNPGRMKILAKKLFKVIQKLQELAKPMRSNLLGIFDQFTVDEWITSNIQDQLSHFKDLYNKTTKLLEPKSWSVRPFKEPVPEAKSVAAQMTVQSGAQNIPVQRSPDSDQSSRGRLQMDFQGAGGRGGLNSHGVQGQGAVGVIQKKYSSNGNNGNNQAGVLSNSLLRGSDRSAQVGPMAATMDRNGMRPAPQNQPMLPSVNSPRQQNFGLNAPGFPQAGNQQGIARLQNQQGFLLSQQGLSQNQQGLPLTQQGLPLNQQGLPLNQQGLPLNQQGLSQNQQILPLTQQGLPLNQQGFPLNQQGLPLNQQGLPLNQQGLPLNLHGLSQAQNEQGLFRQQKFPPPQNQQGTVQAQNQHAPAQNLLRVNQNPREQNANQHNLRQNLSNQRLAQSFHKPSVEVPPNFHKIETNAQHSPLSQQEMARKSLHERIEDSHKQREPPMANGPSEAENWPINLLQTSNVKDQREGKNDRLAFGANRETNREGNQDAPFNLPTKDNELLDDKDEDLRNFERNDNEAKETGFLDSFVGRRGFKKGDLNGNFDGDAEKGVHRMDKGKSVDYNYDGDEAA